MTGRVSYLAGLSAEDSIARRYQASGATLCAQRWRGTGGEIDLIAEEGDTVVFIEVKKARDFARAAYRLSAAQIGRLYATAEEYLGTLPNGGLRNARFDVALLNAQGECEIIENALCA